MKLFLNVKKLRIYGLDTHKRVIIPVKWSIAVSAIGRKQVNRN